MQDEAFKTFLGQFDGYVPTDQQAMQIELVRSGVKELATDLYQVLPDGPDRSAAIRKLREVMMTAVEAIVRAAPKQAVTTAPGDLSIPWFGGLTGASVDRKADPEKAG